MKDDLTQETTASDVHAKSISDPNKKHDNEFRFTQETPVNVY